MNTDSHSGPELVKARGQGLAQVDMSKVDVEVIPPIVNLAQVVTVDLQHYPHHHRPDHVPQVVALLGGAQPERSRIHHVAAREPDLLPVVALVSGHTFDDRVVETG